MTWKSELIRPVATPYRRDRDPRLPYHLVESFTPFPVAVFFVGQQVFEIHTGHCEPLADGGGLTDFESRSLRDFGSELLAQLGSAFGNQVTQTRCGRMIAAMEEPLATRTSIAVTTKASRIAFIVVIDSSL